MFGGASQRSLQRLRFATEEEIAEVREIVAVSGASQLSLQRLRFATEEEMPEVRDMVAFDGRADLRRACRLTTVMRCGAAILQNSVGTANTYDLSEAVEMIDTFLSHNWSVSRLDKFLCLVLHFNLPIAALMMVATGIVVVGAACSDFTFLWGAKSPILAFNDEAGQLVHGWGCTLLMPLVFLLGAFFGHELQRLVGLGGCSVFLDKICIDQIDLDRQREGIVKLGAFLRSSSAMLVLYTDIYLTKLWTVYEVACFLSLHPTSRLMVVPTEQPMVVFGWISVYYVEHLAAIFFWSDEFAVTITTITIVGILAAVTVLLRRWAREMEAIQRRLSNFEVGHCTCFCEEDRPLVHKNIVLLMRAGGWVGRAGTEEDALLAFNDIVRTRLSRSIAASIGTIGIRYRHAILMLFVTVVPKLVDIYLLGESSSQVEWITRFRICTGVEIAIQCFGTFPLVLALMSRWCGLCLHLKGFQEVAFLCVSVALAAALSVVVLQNLAELTVAAARGDDRNMWAAIQAVVLVSSTLLAIGVYSRGWQLREEEEEHIEMITLKEGRQRRRALQLRPDLAGRLAARAEVEQAAA